MDRKSLNIILVIITIIVAFAFVYTLKDMRPAPITPVETETPQEQETETPTEVEQNNEQNKVFLNVFFIGQNKNKEEVYKAVKRQYDASIDGSPIKFAITALFDGPTPEETKLGVYSEIPVGTRLLNVVDAQDGVYINLSRQFEQGGGSDSIYKRIFQLIKTSKNNTNKPVYLLIEGNKVDVIGGDGIMLTQPLSEESLGE